MKLNKLKITTLTLALMAGSAINIVRAHRSSDYDPIPAAVNQAEDCEKAKKKANDIIDQLVAENFDAVREHFNENMKQSLSLEQLKATWNGVKTDRGAYKSRDKSLFQEFPVGYAVHTRLQLEQSRIVITINFGEDGKIAGMFLNPA